MKPFKPWRAFADQLQQLQDRGLHEDKLDVALDYPDLGYSRLSGYWYPLRTIDAARRAGNPGQPVSADATIAAQGNFSC
jgi:abortive infection bacteriophage resistance protein